MISVLYLSILVKYDNHANMQAHSYHTHTLDNKYNDYDMYILFINLCCTDKHINWQGYTWIINTMICLLFRWLNMRCLCNNMPFPCLLHIVGEVAVQHFHFLYSNKLLITSIVNYYAVIIYVMFNIIFKYY